MVKWVRPERLSVRWVNRAQNMSILSLCDVVTGVCTTVRTALGRIGGQGNMCIQLVYLFLSDIPEKRADVREVAGSSGDGADHCLFLSDICLKCQYFAVIWTAAVNMYLVVFYKQNA